MNLKKLYIIANKPLLRIKLIHHFRFGHSVLKRHAIMTKIWDIFIFTSGGIAIFFAYSYASPDKWNVMSRYVVRLAKEWMHTKCLTESFRNRDHMSEVTFHGRIILKWLIKKRRVTVSVVVEALRYKSEGRVFENRWRINLLNTSNRIRPWGLLRL
jgi:hypothetical protein